jgi:hypothetical protein
MTTFALTNEERNAVIDGMMRELGNEKVLKLFEEPEARRRLVDYAEIADDFGFGEPSQETYPIERSIPALRRALTLWRNVAEGWLNSKAGLEERELYRLEIWTECQNLLARLPDDD